MKPFRWRFYMALTCFVVFAVALTGVSYAWITLTTNPEITSIVASVDANQNLEIALDDGYATATDVDIASASQGGAQGSTAGDPYTWGNLVDLSRAFSTGAPQLRQVKFQLAPQPILQYPRYGLDGRLQDLGELQANFVSDYDGKGEKGGVTFYAQGTRTDNSYAYSVTYWMRSNLSGDVTLSDAAKRADDGTDINTGVNGVMGGGSCIRIPLAGNSTAAVLDGFVSKLRVAFVDETAVPPALIFEASVGAGESDGIERVYPLVTLASDVGASPVYVSEQGTRPIRLEANVARKVTMFVYVDGEDLTNKDALQQDVTGVQVNVQFAHSAITVDTPGGGAMTGDTTPDSVYGETP